MKTFEIASRSIAPDDSPLVIAKGGINRKSNVDKAVDMAIVAAASGFACAPYLGVGRHPSLRRAPRA